MDCYKCESELVWGGDNSYDEVYGDHDYDVVTNLTCPNCGAYHEVCWNQNLDEKGKKHNQGN